jgi:integrase
MTEQVSHGARSRRPVFLGNRRVRGLHERTLANGTTVYESRLRIDRRDRWLVLEAQTKTDAIHEHEALRVDRQRGETRHDRLSPTTDEIAADLIAHMQARVGITDRRRRYAQSTVDLYRQRFEDHIGPYLGSRRVGDVTTDDLRRLIDTLTRKGLAPSTITSAVNILSRLFRYAVKRKLVPHNPVRDLDRDDRPGVQRQSEPRYLSADELRTLLSKLGDTMRPAAAACTYAGLRVSEALGLRWRDLDFKAGTITIAGQLGRDGKTWIPVAKTEASAATVPMLPVLRRETRRAPRPAGSAQPAVRPLRRARVLDHARQAAVTAQPAPRRLHGRRRRRVQRRRARAGGVARSPPLVRGGLPSSKG